MYIHYDLFKYDKATQKYLMKKISHIQYYILFYKGNPITWHHDHQKTHFKFVTKFVLRLHRKSKKGNNSHTRSKWNTCTPCITDTTYRMNSMKTRDQFPIHFIMLIIHDVTEFSNYNDHISRVVVLKYRDRN